MATTESIKIQIEEIEMQLTMGGSSARNFALRNELELLKSKLQETEEPVIPATPPPTDPVTNDIPDEPPANPVDPDALNSQEPEGMAEVDPLDI